MKVREMAQMVVRLPEADKKWVQKTAAGQERSQNWFIANLVKNARLEAEQRL